MTLDCPAPKGTTSYLTDAGFWAPIFGLALLIAFSNISEKNAKIARLEKELGR